MTTIAERRRRFSAVLAQEITACKTVEEQEQLIREAIKVGIGAYTLRFREAPPAAQQQCIQTLDDFIVDILRANAFALMHSARK
jgi:hypothetical protein